MQSTAALQIHTAKRGRSAVSALLPALALFAALSLALLALIGAPADPSALLCGAAVVCLCALLPKWPAYAAGTAAAGAALALILIPGVRAGALTLVNRLYESSEAVNAYAYRHFAATGSAGAALPAVGVLLGALCVLTSRRRGALWALFAGVAFLEAYFGVTPGTGRNLFLFAVLALLLVFDGQNVKSAGALLAAIATVSLAVRLLVPAPIASVEAYSEHLRDELGRAAAELTQRVQRQEEEANRAHQESRQHEESAQTDVTREGARQIFERQTEREREVSPPRRVDWLRAAALLLAAVVLLIAPFLPFLLLNRVKNRTAERRAAFADEDNAAAIRAMFAHTMDWLRASGLQTENRPYASCAEAVKAITSAEYAAQYAEAALIWQEAAYSCHAMTGAQRQTVRALLDKTAETLYEKANRRTRLRMRYIDCLCGS
ncbi:MAG: hypothetical protein IJU66_03780 [Oscillospiraceae bacterium]|nr:hypothetical protein [Oscillospiraceae bacterium]